MVLAVIDQKIAELKQLQGSISAKLVDLDASITYQRIRTGSFTGTTSKAITALGDEIYLMWALSGLIHDELAKVDSVRSHSPMPWEREKWLRDLTKRLASAVICEPSANVLDFADPAKPATLSLGTALSDLERRYEAFCKFSNRIDAQLLKAADRAKVLEALADHLGATHFKPKIHEILAQIAADPLGVSIDSFSSIETHLRRLNSEVDERNTLAAILKDGRALIEGAGALVASASIRAKQCQNNVGQCQQIPDLDFGDILEWGQTLQSKQMETELNSLKVGVAKWRKSLDQMLSPVKMADAANKDLLSRFQEVVGRFSAAQAQARITHHQSIQSEKVASDIRSGLAKTPKDVGDLEQKLALYERLIRLDPS